MKPTSNPFLRTLLSGIRAPFQLTLVVTAGMLSGAWAANDLYWDIDGATAGGSGGSTAVGNWGTSTFWSDSAAGSSATLTATTTNINDLHFSAGTDVTGASTVTVTGTQSANMLIFEEGAVTLSGGTSITLGGGGGVTPGLQFVNGTGANIINTALVLGADSTFTNLDNTTQVIGGGITGTANLIINNNSTGGTTIGTTGTLNHAGTVTNSGSGAGATLISSVIGSNVGVITQDSTTSFLRLTGDNSAFAAGVYIKSGTVTGATSANAFGSAAIRLGNDSAAGVGNNASATLVLNYGGTYANDVVLGNTSGALTISTPNSSTAQVLSGGISGNNNLILSNTGAQTFTISSSAGKEITINGTITGASTTTSATTISQKINSGVTGIIQNVQGTSASTLNLTNTANAFNGNITVLRGNIGYGGTGAFGAVTNSVILGDAAGAVGTFNDASLVMTGAYTITNPIILEANAAGLQRIVATTGSTHTINSDITLNGKVLTFSHNSSGGSAVMNVHSAAGSFIGNGSLVNAGTSTGIVNLAGSIGSNVTSVTQNSATSQLRLAGNNAFGSLIINAGAVEGRQAAGITTSLGGGTVTLGGSGTDSASLFGQGVNATFGNAIVLGSTSGTLTIGALAATAPVTFTGGITGTNNINLSAGSNAAGASPVTFSGGSINNTGTITNATVTGTSEITISSVIGSNVTGLIQNSATSGMTLLGAQTFTAPITITQGILSLGADASLAGGTINVNGGTLRAAGNNAIGTSGSPVITIGDNSSLSLQSGGINTLLLNTTTPASNVLSFSSSVASAFKVDLLGSTSDLVDIGSGLVSIGSGPVTINANAIGQLTAGTRTIMTSANGGLNAGGGFVLDQTTGNFGGSQISLTNLGTSLVLNVTAASAAPTVLYFNGSQDNNFSTFTGGNTNNSNFSTDAAGTVNAFAAPDAGTELHIQATNLASATRTVTLGRDFAIKSLFIDSQVANALTIASGVGSSALTIGPSSASEGITVNSSAGGTVAISAPVILAGNQTFTNNSANLLTISGGVSGTSNLELKANAAGGITISTGGLTTTGTLVNSGSGTGVATINGVLGSNITSLLQNSATSNMTLSGSAANTFTGPTTVTAGSLTLGKTAGVTALTGDILINGGNLSFSADNQIADTAAVTLTAGTFNTTAGVPNIGFSALDEKFTTLSVSGTGHYNNGNNAAETGVEITGTATFTGGSGASFFGGSGTLFTANTLNLINMSRTSTSATGAPTLAQISDGFIVFGNNAEQSVINVGSGGLNLEGSNIVLRAGIGGSKVTLDGDVTTTGSSTSGIVFDATGGTTGSTSVDLAKTATGATTRTFNIGGGGADMLIGVAVANGSSSAATLNKTGLGKLTLSAAATYTGATNIQSGTLQIGAGGANGSLSASSAISISDGATLRTARSGTLTLSQAITGAGSLEVANTATGITSLTGADKAYTGATVVNSGVLNVTAAINASTSIQINDGASLELGASQRILDSAAISLINGSTLNTKGFSETAGTLSLTGLGNTINLADGASILQFADSSGVVWGGSVNILNWTGTATTGGGTDQVIFGTSNSGLTTPQLDSIFFVNPFGDGNTYTAQWSSGLNGEIVPGFIIPEPSAFLLVSISGLGLAMRRKRK
ncbi:autotransporter-associated beta strand repeat-containing protein [Luteolibacter sp. SL250]|uniref:beta strand repeat-containing protein n=1 Tax=Luteolibacter sp. SL250 TaxID=2995170 RepID=UPI00226FC143|nr:autotransporter-associated beta strand repeat-containing protein [Luteolibacter sp. SL250]WAC18563.1 autotransporter-associated beta strand repeat-containing protein [Luteolibacter sp. SL250]